MPEFFMKRLEIMVYGCYNDIIFRSLAAAMEERG